MMIRINFPLPPQHFRVLTDFLAVIDRVSAGGFSPFAGFEALDDGDAVAGDSRLWLGRFLKPEANPYQEGLEVLRFAHHATPDTPDVLWHGYVLYDDLEVAVLESAESVLVRITPTHEAVLGIDDDASEAQVFRLADRVIALTGSYDDPFGQPRDYRWTFVYDPPLRDGSRFTSGPDSDPYMLTSWTERLDGGIHKGVLFFHGYKVRGAGDGCVVSLDGRHWFDGRCWAPYQEIRRP